MNFVKFKQIIFIFILIYNYKLFYYMHSQFFHFSIIIFIIEFYA